MNGVLLMSPHERLSSARIAGGFSVEQIAAELNLTVSVIRAIEDGRYDSLYGEAFVSGVLGAYARFLGLDASVVVRAYKDSLEPVEVVVDKKATHKFSGVLIAAQHKNYRTGYGLAAVLALAVLVGIFAPAEKLSTDRLTEESIVIDTTVGTTIVNTLNDMPAENPTQDLLPDMFALVAPTVSGPAPASHQSLASTAHVASNEQEGLSSLRFTFSADCWVEIHDGDNQKIFASLQRAEQRLELTGKPPFRITLGYAPGVAISYNSKPVLIDVDDSNIARLVLGNS